MGNFSEHIQQAKNNLDFLSKVNASINNNWDWQVTTCFYVAVHLINGHIVSKTSKNYLSHDKVAKIINPYSTLSVAKLDEETYVSYTKLHLLSRRSRYLLNEGFAKKGIVEVQPACITYDKHFKKAIYHLDKIMTFMTTNYSVVFDKKELTCIEFKGSKYDNFKIK